MSEPPETHVPIADGWALLIAQVVVLWGAVDNSMENVTEALRTFPECLGVPPSTHHSFAKRAAHWHALHLVYFASLPRMKKFGSQTHKRLMDVSSERDLFVHGRYGFKFGPTGPRLMLSFRPKKTQDKFDFKLYSPDELGKFVGEMRQLLFVIESFERGIPADSLTSQWGIPQKEVADASTRLSSIRDSCFLRKQQLYAQSHPPS
jgi:hypothetical protein